MLKDRGSVDYIVHLLTALARLKRATSAELYEHIKDTPCNSPTYARKILGRMANSGLVKANNTDGYTLTKPYDQYTLADVLEATGSVALHESPASRAEAKLAEMSRHIKLDDIL